FSPNYVVLFKNTTNNSLYLNKTIFTDEVYNPIQPYLVEIVIIIIFILYNNIVFIMLFTSTINIRRYAKKFVLNYIPFFGEYMIFSSVYVFVFFVTTLSMLFIISIRAFTIILLAFICVINRDYYSV
ncbi:MAG: hypothetical protein LBG48_02065, partial [Rickettsiales bacterium]|nr:hypothetical protein [Rickettsiales bacterium]